MIGAEQEFCQAGEVVLQYLFVEGNSGEAQEIVFEIVEVPGDRLAVEAVARIADFVVQIASGFDLKARQDFDDLAIRLDDRRRNRFSGAVRGEKFKEGGVSEIFLEVSVVVEIGRVDFRDGQSVLAEMAGELDEGGVLLAHTIKDADRGDPSTGEADDLAP